MIYLITNHYEEYKRRFDSPIFKHIKVCTEKEGKQFYYEISAHNRNAYIDTETNGLDCYINSILMTGIYFKTRHSKHFFIFDTTCNLTDIVEDLTKHYVIAHNAKFDIKMLQVETGILIKNLYDTMLAEQRLFMGMGYKNGYADLVSRYTGKIVLKGTRNEFIGANTETFRITSKQIDYLIGDLIDLETIKKKQQPLIKKNKQEFLIYGIENPLVAVIANAEIKGIKFNTEKWLANVKKVTQEKEELLNRMDELVRHYRDTLSTAKKEYLTGGKWDKKRVRANFYDAVNKNGTIDIPNLFGEHSSMIDLFRKGKSNKVVKKSAPPEEYPGCLKYTKGEFLYILGALGQPAIRADDSMGIPTLRKDKQVVTNPNEFSAKDDLINRYLILRPDSPVKEFIKSYNKLQKLSKSLDTYGKAFIEKVNPVSGYIHTIYRQCEAETGRFQSGGGDNEPDKFNSQNLPRDKAYREPFEAREGYLLDTDDYSGAELIVMASQAQDFDLIELDKSDMHSTLATRSWRNIYKHRANTYFNVLSRKDTMEFDDVLEYQKLYEEAIKNSVSFTVTRTEPEGYRQDFKPMGFKLKNQSKLVGFVSNFH